MRSKDQMDGSAQRWDITGFFNEANLDACQTAGVKLTCIPQSGGKRSAEREALEKSRRSNAASGSVPASKVGSPCCSEDGA